MMMQFSLDAMTNGDKDVEAPADRTRGLGGYIIGKIS